MWRDRKFRISLLLLTGLFAPLHSMAQETKPAPTLPRNEHSLDNDARLEHKVTLDEVGIPLREVLHKLSKQGLALSCDSSCDEQKVQIRLKHRSLSVLMQSLAEMLPGTWTPYSDRSGYRLAMTKQAVKRRSEWWELFLGERDRAIAAQRAYVVTKMRENVLYTEHHEPGIEENSPEGAERMTRLSSFYRLLPAALQEQIAAHMLTNVFFSKDGGTGFPQEDETIVPLNTLPEAAQRIIREYVPTLQSSEDTSIAFCNVAIAIMPRIMQPGKPPVQANTTLGVGFAPDAVALQAAQPGFVAIVKKRGKTAPLEWQRLAAYQESRVWQNDIPTLQEHSLTPFRRAELLDWLADKGDMEFVADYYSQVSQPLSVSQKEAKPSRPIAQELNHLCAQEDMSWKKRTDSIYLIRDNRWYRDDGMEVPAALLRQWEEAPLPQWKTEPGKLPSKEDVMRRIVAQLDRELDMVTHLSPWQISNGLDSYVKEKGSREFDPQNPKNFPDYAWRPFVHIAKHTLKDYSFLQFYAGLTPDMRQALLHGGLPYSALNAMQQQRARYLLPELQVVLARQSTVSPLLDIGCELPNYESASGYYSVLQPIRLFNFSLILAPPNR